MRRLIALGLGAALYAGSALAIPPGPDEIGEFYVYFSRTGQIVGQATMSCEGVLHQTGVRTNLFGNGYFVCDPD